MCSYPVKGKIAIIVIASTKFLHYSMALAEVPKYLVVLIGLLSDAG